MTSPQNSSANDFDDAIRRELAEYRSGELTAQELTEAWATRQWPDMHDPFGPPIGGDIVEENLKRLRAAGIVSPEEVDELLPKGHDLAAFLQSVLRQQINDELADYRAGHLTLDALAEIWAQRDWGPVTYNDHEVGSTGGIGSELSRLIAIGSISVDEYRVILQHQTDSSV
jgi:hypothetical protein